MDSSSLLSVSEGVFRKYTSQRYAETKDVAQHALLFLGINMLVP
jgi:hypothetical protein